MLEYKQKANLQPQILVFRKVIKQKPHKQTWPPPAMCRIAVSQKSDPNSSRLLRSFSHRSLVSFSITVTKEWPSWCCSVEESLSRVGIRPESLLHEVNYPL